MSLSILISLLGGIALFLFGMTLMGEGLKRVAGSKLELVLYRLSSTPLKGMALGCAVTAAIQSSSATSVMAVGFVNSRIMKLKQAISIIMGAVIGTSITGWIICLSSFEGNGWTSLLTTTSISSIIAVVGIVLRMFSKDKGKKNIGDILLGFAVLMFGMHYMSSAVEPLRSNESFLNVLTAFSNPLMGIAAGIVFAAVLQSASAAVGILQALSLTGAITFAIAWPILLGINIGASLPVLLSSIGAKTDGKRTAWAYFFISLFGSVLSAAVFYSINSSVGFSFFNEATNMVGIAAANTVFRLASGVILLPFCGALERLLQNIIKQSDEERKADEDLDRLDERFLSHPAMAVEQSRLTVNSMAAKSKQNILNAIDLLYNYTPEGFDAVEQQEDYIDRYEDKIGTYLLKLNTQSLTVEQNERVTEFLHVITDFERISDHAMNVAESAREIYENKITFSPSGTEELNVLVGAVKEILDIAIDAFIEYDTDRERLVEPLEERIDILCSEIKSRHVARMQKQECSMNVGFVFNDLLSNFERVGDHCSNIALALIEIGEDDFDMHDAAKTLTNEALYEEYSKKYALREISG